MIRSRLHAPSGAAEIVADAVRVLAVIGIVVAGIGWTPVDALSLAAVAVVMFLPRLLGLRPSVDIAFGLVALVAVWSSVLEIYITTRWWDLPVHFAANGLFAAVFTILLVRARVVADFRTLPRPMLSAAVTTTAVGMSLGVLWEVFEWYGHTFLDDEIYVAYVDTIGDLVWGTAGAVLAGCLMPFLSGPSPAGAAGPFGSAGPGAPDADDLLPPPELE